MSEVPLQELVAAAQARSVANLHLFDLEAMGKRESSGLPTCWSESTLSS